MKTRWYLASALFLALISAVMIVGSAAAQQPTPSDDEVNAIAKQLYCPVCENIPLDVCPTTACEQWRGLIREKLTEGWNEQQIKDFFVLQYGDRVLAEPPRRGLNWMVYVLPPVIILGGVILVANIMRKMRRSATISPQPTSPAGDSGNPAGETNPANQDYLNRFEDELRKRSG